MKKLICIFFISCFARQAVAQVAIGYFPWNYSKVQLTSNPDNFLFGDLRVETNSFISNLNLELALYINLLRKEEYNLYLGTGIVTYPFFENEESFINGYFTSVGVRWMPIEKLPQLGFIFELSPYLDKSFEAGRLRSFLGVSYHFGKNKS